MHCRGETNTFWTLSWQAFEQALQDFEALRSEDRKEGFDLVSNPAT